MGINRLKIATKLWVFIGIVLVLLSTVATVGLLRSAGILAEGRAQQQVAYKMVQVATRWNGLTETNATRNLAMIVSSDPEIASAFKDAVDATTKEISEMQKQLDTLPLTDADKAQLQKIGEFRKAVISTREKARAARTEGKAHEALPVGHAQFPATLGS